MGFCVSGHKYIAEDGQRRAISCVGDVRTRDCEGVDFGEKSLSHCCVFIFSSSRRYVVCALCESFGSCYAKVRIVCIVFIL